MAKRKKIYRPELVIESSSDLPIEVKAYNDSLFSELQNGKGLIKVKLDSKVVIQRISHDLYANWESGIRELLNNEVRACKITKQKHGLDSRIEITLDVVNKKLIVHGINSLGIDSKTFLKVLRVLGRSDNFDSSVVGQFGFGFASYTTISDTVILETYSLETKEKYSVVGKSGIGFDILPKPDLETYGTRISLIYDKLDKEDKEIYEAIKEFSQYKDIPIYLNLPYPIKEAKNQWVNGDKKEVYEVTVKSGRELVSMVGLKPILQKRICRYANSQFKESDFVLIEKENKDFSFIGYISKISDRNTYRDEFDRGEILLILTPIGDSSFQLKPFKNFIVNVKNERKYKPTPDRERLKEESLEKLEKEVSELALEGLHDLIDFETWRDLIKNSHKWFLYKHLLHCDSIKEQIPFRKVEMLGMLSCEFRVYTDREVKPQVVSLKKIITEHRYNDNQIYYSVMNIESVIRSVFHAQPHAIVILTKNVGLMEKLGFADIKKVVGLGESIGKTKVSVHSAHITSSGWGYSDNVIKRYTEAKLLCDLLNECQYSKVIIVDSRVKDVLGILSETETDYKIVKLKAKQKAWILNQYEEDKEDLTRFDHGLITFNQFMKEIETKQFATNRGILSGKQILKRIKNTKVYLHDTHLKDTVNYMRNKVYLYVALNSNEAFEVKVYLSFNCKNSEYSELKSYEDFRVSFSRDFENLDGYCSKCGHGTEDYRKRKTYSDFTFWLKVRLGDKNKDLYDIFVRFTETTNKIDNIEGFGKLLVTVSQTRNKDTNPQLSRDLLNSFRKKPEKDQYTLEWFR